MTDRPFHPHDLDIDNSGSHISRLLRERSGGDVSRTVAYSWGPRANGLTGHEEAARLLHRAQRDGVVSQWDADTDWRSLWFTGKPGAKLRHLRRELWRLWVMA